ncbi:DNA-3-methyladenine glycosylase 1 [bacterium HR40]|nr:DNA-3-methyladenine glycosylase 1 [bacterium HR40]
MDERGLVAGADGRVRCFWCAGDPLYQHYHDVEWGRPTADDQRLFEKLCLETFQAGLSWALVLHRREALRRAFAGFDMTVLARFTAADVARLLADPTLIRHRGKIEATIANARAALATVEQEGSLARFLWRFAPSRPLPPPRHAAELAARISSPEAVALSRALRARGFRFLGPKSLYAFMQAMGFVDDHLADCWVRPEVEAERARFRPPS